MIPKSWNACLICALAGAALLGAGCGTPSAPSSSATTAPATTTSTVTTGPPNQSSSPVPIPTSSAAEAQAEQQDLNQAQQDIADLEKALSAADSGLNANPNTEGDVNP